MANTYGVESDPFGLAGEVGKLEKFQCVRVRSSTQKDNAVVRDDKGEFIPDTDKTFNEREELTAEYEPIENGAVGGGVIAVGGATALAITRVAIATTGTGHVKVTVTGHQHGASLHTANARDLTLPAFNGFGGANFLALTGVTDAEVQQSSWDAEIGHDDKQNNVGDFLAGRSQGVKLTASVDAVSDAEPALPAETEWLSDGIDKQKGQDFWTVSAKAHQHLAAPA